MIREATTVHTRLLRFTLGVDECRAYWRAYTPESPLQTTEAFERYTFGQKSEARVKVTLRNLRARFDAFPPSLAALHDLPLQPQSVSVICHWHTMLADPMYRTFVLWLQTRRERGLDSVARDEVARWTEAQQPGRWSGATRIMWASKLLSTANDAGFIRGIRDPRPLKLPFVTDEALLYLMHLLRHIEHQGTPLDNSYLRSVGLDGGLLDDRLRQLDGLSLHRMGALVDLTFEHTDLLSWVKARS